MWFSRRRHHWWAEKFCRTYCRWHVITETNNVSHTAQSKRMRMRFGVFSRPLEFIRGQFADGQPLFYEPLIHFQRQYLPRKPLPIGENERMTNRRECQIRSSKRIQQDLTLTDVLSWSMWLSTVTYNMCNILYILYTLRLVSSNPNESRDILFWCPCTCAVRESDKFSHTLRMACRTSQLGFSESLGKSGRAVVRSPMLGYH